MAIDHTNRGIGSGFRIFGFMMIVIVITFIAPKIDDSLTEGSEKIAKSIVFRCVQFL
jgi:hypothetical protein